MNPSSLVQSLALKGFHFKRFFSQTLFQAGFKNQMAIYLSMVHIQLLPQDASPCAAAHFLTFLFHENAETGCEVLVASLYFILSITLHS